MNFREALEVKGVRFFDGTGNSHARTGWIQLNCPECSHQHGSKYHLGWHKRQSYFHCWKCGKLPTKLTLSKILRIPSKEASDLLRSWKNEYTDEEEVKIVGKYRPPKGLIEGKLSAPHTEYIRARGFNPARLMRVWGLGSIGLTPEHAFQWRIFIPIHHRGEAVSWTTRSINPKATTRYMSASLEREKINHKTLLYGMDHVRGTAICVEGPADAWNVGEGAVAVLGLSHTAEQILALSKIPNRVICFDSSKSAQTRAEMLAENLAVFPGETHVVALDAEDPGSASKREIKRLRKHFGL